MNNDPGYHEGQIFFEETESLPRRREITYGELSKMATSLPDYLVPRELSMYETTQSVSRAKVVRVSRAKSRKFVTIC
jgi:hypothetical protein